MKTNISTQASQIVGGAAAACKKDAFAARVRGDRGPNTLSAFAKYRLVTRDEVDGEEFDLH